MVTNKVFLSFVHIRWSGIFSAMTEKEFYQKYYDIKKSFVVWCSYVCLPGKSSNPSNKKVKNSAEFSMLLNR